MDEWLEGDDWINEGMCRWTDRCKDVGQMGGWRDDWMNEEMVGWMVGWMRNQWMVG